MDSFVISSHWKLFFLSQNTVESGYPKCNYIRHKILKNILRYLFIFSTRYSICITRFSSIHHNIIKYTSQDKDHTCTFQNIAHISQDYRIYKTRYWTKRTPNIEYTLYMYITRYCTYITRYEIYITRFSKEATLNQFVQRKTISQIVQHITVSIQWKFRCEQYTINMSRGY